MEPLALTLIQQTHRYDKDVFDGYTTEIASLMDTPPFASLSEVAAQTEIFTRQRQLGIDALYCIIDSSSNFYGQATLMNIPSGVPEIGIWVVGCHQRKGVGKMALGLLLKESRSFGVTKCLYPVREENLPSIRLVSNYSTNFETSGCIRNYVIRVD